MDIASRVFRDLLSPQALLIPESIYSAEPADEAALDLRRARVLESGWHQQQPSTPWSLSPLNPQSRINSLDSPTDAAWRFDGMHRDGQRLFLVPRFAVGKPPLRIDVFIPPPEDVPRQLWDVLRPWEVFCCRGHGSMPAMVAHVLRALDAWTKDVGESELEREYSSLPFGSSIVVSAVEASVRVMSVGVEMVAEYGVEQAMFTVEGLRGLWSHELDHDAWPEILDWDELCFRRQVAEAISVVQIPSKMAQREVVFKALTRDLKHMYHELKTLMTLNPHKNVIGRPYHVVVKKGRFGGRKAVCGFTAEYFPRGTLQEKLAAEGRMLGREEPCVTLGDRVRWAKQIISALTHVNSHPGGFYPDLKPDNIVFRETENGKLDAVLLDFEQRGGWFSWSPPEVVYVEYLEILAEALQETGDDEKITRHLKKYMAGWKPPRQDERYRNVRGGFSRPWTALLEAKDRGGVAQNDLEKAQVFMLGKLLWCIFESRPSLGSGLDHEILLGCASPDLDNGPAFPQFRRTPGPGPIRDLIRRCTAGAREWDRGASANRPLRARKGKLIPVAWDVGVRGWPTEQDVVQVAREWWRVEVSHAESYLESINMGIFYLDSMSSLRPSLQDVLDQLDSLEPG